MLEAISRIVNEKQLLFFPFLLVFIEVVTYLSTDMYLPALPSIAEYFTVSHAMAQYTQTLWFVGSMSMQLFLGPLCELYGRKEILLIGIITFFVSSLICGLTSSITFFLIARFFQGTTVCCVIVAGYALIHELYSGKRAVQILAIMSSITILAPALGPLLGAIIINFSAWQNIFIILAFLSVIGLFGISCTLPVSNKDSAKKINLWQEVSTYKAIVCNRTFISIASVNSLLIINFFMWIVESPFIIIGKYNLSEFYFAILQLVVFGGYILGAQLARKLIISFSTNKILTLGFSIISISLLLFLMASLTDSSTLWVVLAMAGVALGSSSMSGVFNRLAISSSTEPMSHRVAIYTLMVSLAASVGSYIVTLDSEQSFTHLGYMMAACFILAISIFMSIRKQIVKSEL